MYNHQLDTFIRTADLGSFGKAGEALYISSTAVIQQINLLENLCGFRLFVRSNHGVKLTPAGRSLYEDAKTLIRFSEDALHKAKLLAESLTFHLFPGRFYGFDRSENESHCPQKGKHSTVLKNRASPFGVGDLLSSHGSLGKLNFTSLALSLFICMHK